MTKRKSAISELLAEAGARVENGVETGLANGTIEATEGFDANGSPTRESAFTPAQLLAATLPPEELAKIAAAGPGPILEVATAEQLGLQPSDFVLESEKLSDAEIEAAITGALDEVLADTTDLPQVAILIEPSPLNENGTINSGFDFWSKRS